MVGYLGGIYQIRNLITNDIYIGQATNLGARRRNHFFGLRHKNHSNKYLQRACNKYGIENFVFEILVYCESFELTRYEQALVDRLDPKYNILKLAVDSSKGTKLSIAVRKKISELAKNRNYTPEQRAEIGRKISISKAGKSHKRHSEETKRKMSLSQLGNKNHNYGKPLSDDMKKKLSAILSGRRKSPETREKMRLAQKLRREREKTFNG